MLTAEELARLGALAHGPDQAMFRSAHVLGRVTVAEMLAVDPHEVDLVQRCQRCGGPHGVPRTIVGGTPGPHLSLAHADGIVMAATADRPVGIDLEPVGQAPTTIEPVVLSEAEQAQWSARPDRDLTRWWVRKEAVLKAAGVGLSVDPREVEVTPPWEAPRLVRWPAAPAPYVMADVPLPGFVVAVAAAGAEPLEVEVEQGRWPRLVS